MRLADATLVLLDFETSHQDEVQAEIVEVAALRCDGGLWPDAAFESFVFNERPLSAEVSGVHGLTDADLSNAPKLREVEAQLAAFIPADAVLVAHYGSGYDFPLGLRCMPSAFAGRPLLCTDRLARHVDPNAPNFKLSTLRYRYGHGRIDAGPAHRALADVLVLREVLGSLLWRTPFDREAADFTERVVAFTASPIWIERFQFGKYKTGRVADCNDASYLMWCLANMDDLRPDTRWTLGCRLSQIIANCTSRTEIENLARDRNATEAQREMMRQRWAALREAVAA